MGRYFTPTGGIATHGSSHRAIYDATLECRDHFRKADVDSGGSDTVKEVDHGFIPDPNLSSLEVRETLDRYSAPEYLWYRRAPEQYLDVPILEDR